jgi:hypothetical protein
MDRRKAMAEYSRCASEIKIFIRSLYDPCIKLSRLEQTSLHQMPKELLEELKTWEIIEKSPMSKSFYNNDERLRISDHWNYITDKGYRKLTNIYVFNYTHFTLCRFNKELLNPKIMLKGTWEVILSLPKDKTIVKEIERLRAKKRWLRYMIKENKFGEVNN